MRRFPAAAVGLILATVAASALAFRGHDPHPPLALWRGAEFRRVQLVTHLFLHADWFHLSANMLFLWVLGSAVNAKLGHVWFVPLYLARGIGAGVGWVALGHGRWA